jgi:hypothetical protein
MASKVNSTYYVGNIPIYAGPKSGAHTPNGCLFNINIRVKPEVNTVGLMFIKTSDPLIHSLDNTTTIPQFELDFSNLNKFITLLKVRNNPNNPTLNQNEFIKLGVTSLSKYADKIKIAWLKSINDSTILVLENNGSQDNFIIEGFYQNEYLLDTLIGVKDMFIQAKAMDEFISSFSSVQIQHSTQMNLPTSPAIPSNLPIAPTTPGNIPQVPNMNYNVGISQQVPLNIPGVPNVPNVPSTQDIQRVELMIPKQP